jgi:UDP-N-acetylglucosamine--N-acetylmuramyl-(pentapeptide) pyrophosphoryl-undecaprenol N-acetylglucosamine transferase
MSGGPIMIMAGGTGGHVFPGLAVAEEVRAQHGAVVWLGTHRGLEARVVPQNGIDMEWISISGLRGRGVLAWLAAPFRIGLAIVQVLATFRRRRPAAVLGMGGFVAGPGGVAAWLARKPLLIHEQNAVAGTTNRVLARFARRVFEAFPGTFPESMHAEAVGNPIRRALRALDAPRERFAARRARRPQLLVLGGSQGARVLNRALPQALALLPRASRPEVWHQAGRGLDEAREGYAANAVEARVEGFIEDVASAYRWADLVVARAGALTIAELEAVGVGAVLVPFRHATDDHQTRNAKHFVAGGAGICIAEAELTPEVLSRELDVLLRDPARLLAMAEAARAQAKPDAAQKLAAACLALAKERP